MLPQSNPFPPITISRREDKGIPRLLQASRNGGYRFHNNRIYLLRIF